MIKDAQKPGKMTRIRLAQALGVSLSGLDLWRAIPGSPESNELEQWQHFIRENNLGSAQARVGKDRETLLAEAVAKRNRLLDLEIAEKERKVVGREDVDGMIHHAAALQKTILYSALERELPAKAAGRSADEIAVIGRDFADRLCEIFSTSIESWRSA